jgi:putative ABC transport system permease protein
MLRDLVHACRLLRKSPLSTAMIILALALGISVNVTIFTAADAVILRPFVYPNLDRIMTVWETIPKLRLERAGVTPADFADFQIQSRSFELIAAYRRWSVNILGGDRPEPVEAVRVTHDFFRIFGMNPKIGQTLPEKDERAAVVSEGLWRSRFAGAQDVIGKAISLGGQNYTIVGVMPDDFDYPLAAQVWVPLTLTTTEKSERVVHNLLVVALLRPGIKAEQAQAEMQSIARTLEQQYPKTNEGWSAAVTPLRQMAEGVTSQFIRVLSVAALFVLLLAGANVANIQLARATNRRKSLAIEAALGASRFRLARSLCVESVLLGLAGGAVGLITAIWWNDANSKFVPASVLKVVPGIRHIQIDSTVLLFTVALSLVTGVLCSLPAIAHLLGRNSSSTVAEALSQRSRSLAGDTRNRMRNILVICEVALALLLLVSAGVMVNTFERMMVLNLGFNPSNLLTAQISLPIQEQGEDSSQARVFFNRLLPELEAIPGVRSASVDANTGQAVDFSIKNRRQPDASEPKPNVLVIDAKYFETMQLPIIRGRGITAQDRRGTTSVVVVSRSIADHYWQGRDPIGQQIHFGQSPWLTIVGVSGDVTNWFFNEPQPTVYVSYQQYAVSNMRLLLRTTGDPALAANALLSRVRAIDPSEPIYEIQSMAKSFTDEMSGVQASARMMTGNAVIALFLAVTGIYAVISYFVSQRTKEIGVRIALGAATQDILKMTVGQACRVAGIGLLIGVPLTYVLMRVLSSMLYNVVVVRWTTFSGVTALLAAAALLAAYLPARRAANVDPVIALRND